MIPFVNPELVFVLVSENNRMVLYTSWQAPFMVVQKFPFYLRRIFRIIERVNFPGVTVYPFRILPYCWNTVCRNIVFRATRFSFSCKTSGLSWKSPLAFASNNWWWHVCRIYGYMSIFSVLVKSLAQLLIIKLCDPWHRTLHFLLHSDLVLTNEGWILFHSRFSQFTSKKILQCL